MDRSRSKRYYSEQDNDSEPFSRTKQRYNNNNAAAHNRRGASGVDGGGRKVQDTNLMVTTSYRILCHDIKAGGVIGKSGSIIKAIRQRTGAWINMHELVPGDEERIIEISDSRRRDPEGRIPSFSPAQEALLMIHERILEGEGGPGGSNVGFGGEEGDYGMRGGGGGNRVVTRLVVLKMHVGCLLGKGGKIIEQMRMETKTHIRVLPRDQNLPRCVTLSDEIVQIVGDVNAVKNAIATISSRLRESQHRDRSNFHGRIQSSERFFSPDDDCIPSMHHPPRKTSTDEPSFGSRLSASYSRESGPVPMIGNSQTVSRKDLVFRILCPVAKIESVVGESDGILELLQSEVGVNVKVIDPVDGSDEQIIIISSEEGPDDEMFPAQEALLHIQTRIVDLVPDKENIITTRLLVPSGEIGCLQGNSGSLSEMRKSTGAYIQILPKEELPVCALGNDELLQIEGEIRAAREALVEVTSILRSNLYQEYSQKDIPTPATLSPVGNGMGMEASSSNNATPSRETYSGNDLPAVSSQNVQNVATTNTTKDHSESVSEAVKPTESERREDGPSLMNRFHGPLVTRSTLEVVIPQYAVPKLITKSRNKLSQISQLSGATVKLIEDGSEATENVIQISGTPEQVDRAQSLLQGFILSTQEDGP